MRNDRNKKWLAPSVASQTQEESIAASALLFLSPLPPSLSLFFRNGDDSLSLSSSCVSDACSSTLTGTEVDQICRDPLRVLALAAFQCSLKHKVSKKSRSKNHPRKKLVSNFYKMRVVYELLKSRNRDEGEDAPVIFSLDESPDAFSSQEATTPAFSLPETTAPATSSSVSEVASMRTSTRIHFTKDREASSSSTTTSTKTSTQKARASKSVKRRADDILSWLLDNGCASEVKIRTAIGDNPDTSKALRFLVKKAEVKRTGAGGRLDPFLYTVTSKRAMES